MIGGEVKDGSKVLGLNWEDGINIIEMQKSVKE